MTFADQKPQTGKSMLFQGRRFANHDYAVRFSGNGSKWRVPAHVRFATQKLTFVDSVTRSVTDSKGNSVATLLSNSNGKFMFNARAVDNAHK
jgi:hypothetical protein